VFSNLLFARYFVMKTDTVFYLLDILRDKFGCEYVSDLHFLGDSQKMRLMYLLEDLEAEDFSLQEWNNALDYIAKEPAQDTPAKAKAALQAALCKEQ